MPLFKPLWDERKGQCDLKAFAGDDGESVVRAEDDLDALVDIQDADMAVVFGMR